MRITNLTVSFKLTHSLPNYSNVSPGVVFTAEIGEGEDPDEVLDELRNRAMSVVEEEVDIAREELYLPALYSDDARFDVVVLRNGPGVYIIPDGVGLGAYADILVRPHLSFRGGDGNVRGHRIDTAISIAVHLAREQQVEMPHGFVLDAASIATSLWADMEARGLWGRIEIDKRKQIWDTHLKANYVVIGPARAFMAREDLWRDVSFASAEDTHAADPEDSEYVRRAFAVEDLDERLTEIDDDFSTRLAERQAQQPLAH